MSPHKSMFDEVNEIEKPRDYLSDDSTFTFRVSSDLKRDFKEACKKQRFSSASAIKRYMENVVNSHSF